MRVRRFLRENLIPLGRETNLRSLENTRMEEVSSLISPAGMEEVLF